MEFFPLFSAAIAVAALFSYLNHRFLKFPTTIGVMAMALVASLVLLAADHLGAEVKEPAVELLAKLRFRESLLDVMLAFLLFAGALHVDIGQLRGCDPATVRCSESMMGGQTHFSGPTGVRGARQRTDD